MLGGTADPRDNNDDLITTLAVYETSKLCRGKPMQSHTISATPFLLLYVNTVL